jgi:hypothetical protein
MGGDSMFDELICSFGSHPKRKIKEEKDNMMNFIGGSGVVYAFRLYCRRVSQIKRKSLGAG